MIGAVAELNIKEGSQADFEKPREGSSRRQ